MNLDKQFIPLQYKVGRIIRREGSRFARWCSMNNYIYRRGKWRKIGEERPVTEEEMWKRYELDQLPKKYKQP